MGNGAHSYWDPWKNSVVHASAASCPLLTEDHLCEHEIPIPSSQSCSWAEQAPSGQRKPQQPRVTQTGPLQLQARSGMARGALGCGFKRAATFLNCPCSNLLGFSRLSRQLHSRFHLQSCLDPQGQESVSVSFITAFPASLNPGISALSIPALSLDSNSDTRSHTDLGGRFLSRGTHEGSEVRADESGEVSMH